MPRIPRSLVALGIASVAVEAVDLLQRSVTADTSAQPVPFSQNWTNIALITTGNDWSGVPGIIAYRGDAMVAATGVDPQTILADGSSTPVNVLANQTNPNTNTTGGVAEFEIANPTIAVQGSGTARAPHIVITFNTLGVGGINVSYNLRDVDGSADNAVQPVAFQYRVGSTGNFINMPAGFVADASTGPSLATQVTPVSVSLPPSVDNQPIVQVRIITSDAVGSDEWIGIDDITISNSLGSAAVANPNPVQRGSTTLLTATVTPAVNPLS